MFSLSVNESAITVTHPENIFSHANSVIPIITPIPFNLNKPEFPVFNPHRIPPSKTNFFINLSGTNFRRQVSESTSESTNSTNSSETTEEILNGTYITSETSFVDLVNQQTKSAWKVPCILAAIAITALTLFDLVSTFLAYRTLVRLAKYGPTPPKELDAEGNPIEPIEPPELKPLSEDEQHAMLVTLFTIMVIGVVELCFCVAAFYGVVHADSRYLLIFMGYVLTFAGFKILASIWEVVEEIQKKEKKPMMVILVSLGLLVFAALVLLFYIMFYLDVKAVEVRIKSNITNVDFSSLLPKNKTNITTTTTTKKPNLI